MYDIGIVLNNALENAIEASSKLAGNKSICLRSYMNGNLFFIEIENDFSDEISISDDICVLRSIRFHKDSIKY